MTKPPNPFRYFDSSPEVIRLVVMMYVRYPLSLRNVEDLLFERGIDICHETVRLWWTRFGPMFAAEIRRKRVQHMRQFTHWRWHLDEVYVKINGEMRYLWRAVDHEGEVLESFVTKTRDKATGHCQGNGDYLLSGLLPAKGRSDFAELFAPAGPPKTDKNTLYLVALTVPVREIGDAEKHPAARAILRRADAHARPVPDQIDLVQRVDDIDAQLQWTAGSIERLARRQIDLGVGADRGAVGDVGALAQA